MNDDHQWAWRIDISNWSIGLVKELIFYKGEPCRLISQGYWIGFRDWRFKGYENFYYDGNHSAINLGYIYIAWSY